MAIHLVCRNQKGDVQRKPWTAMNDNGQTTANSVLHSMASKRIRLAAVVRP
ncbi:hypothetical protein VN12_12925 [Pirellula sp. SH-Sr6A]|nr:hypothetical protein VN12_12925 [Pirellula sp. SH-Sr6A]